MCMGNMVKISDLCITLQLKDFISNDNIIQPVYFYYVQSVYKQLHTVKRIKELSELFFLQNQTKLAVN